MEALTRQRVPIEVLILCVAQQLTETAYEHFTRGELSQDELQQFYGVLRDWSSKSEELLEVMKRLGIVGTG